MIQGLYLGMQAMAVQMEKQDQIAHNLANINTTGFKQNSLFAAAIQKYLADDTQQPFAVQDIKTDAVVIDYREGPAKKTDNPLDCMIKGAGFFTVSTVDGIRYTRNGNFSVNNDGFLVTSDGSKVLGEAGYITLNYNEPVQINAGGEVLQKNESKGILKIVDFRRPYDLLRYGNSYFAPHDPAEKGIKSFGYTVKQGFLEGSNANPIENMVTMIEAYRNYEADQKALLAQDQTLDKAVNILGRNS